MGTPGRLTPEIDEFRSQFEQISSEALALTSPLTDDQFVWRPAATSWSIAECLEHLNATARAYLPALDEGIADAIRRGVYGEGPFSYNWLGRLYVHFNEPPVRWRLQALPQVYPGAGRSRREIIAAFRAYQVQYIDRLRQANGVDLARARVRSPAAAWLRIPLGSGFALIAAHERRHLWQAKKVTGAPGFPSGA
jgi:DinB family protein